MGLSPLWTWVAQHPYKTLGIVIVALIMVWLVLATLLMFISPKLIFHPQASQGVTVTVPHEQLWLTDAENHKIDTVWIKNPEAAQVVLYLHGNRGRLSHFFLPLSEKYSVLAPAYPGYHQSTGSPTNENVYATALLAYDYLLTQGYNEDQIIIFGHSLGGSPAVYAAAQRPSAGKLVIVNTFSSIYNMCWPEWGVGCFFAKSILNTSEYAPYVFNKVRAYHDPHDDVVPYSEGVELFSNFSGTCNKKFTQLPGQNTHSEFDVLWAVSGE